MAKDNMRVYLSIPARSSLGMFVVWTVLHSAELAMVTAGSLTAAGLAYLNHMQSLEWDRELIELRKQRNHQQRELAVLLQELRDFSSIDHDAGTSFNSPLPILEVDR